MNGGTEQQLKQLSTGLHQLFGHLPQTRRRQLGLVLILMLLGALAELLTIGAVLPFLALIADPSAVTAYPAARKIFFAIGWRETSHAVTGAALLFALVVLGAGGVRLLLAWTTQRFVSRLGHDLIVEAYRCMLSQPYHYHTKKNTSELVSAINKVDLIAGGILLPVLQVLTGALISAFILGALFTIDALTAMTSALAFGLIYFVVAYMIRRPLILNSKVIANSWDARIKVVQEGLGSIRDVLIDRTQPIYVQNFARVDSACRDAEVLNNFAGAAPRFVIEASGMIVIALVALVLSEKAGGLVAALPVLGALALGAQRLLPLLQLVYSGWAQATGNLHALLDVLEILDLHVPKPADDLISASPLPFEHEISLEKLSFSYSNGQPRALEDVTLVLRKGARVGFMGRSGSGKSTLLDVIMGLLTPTSGNIKIDGRQLTESTARQWQAQISHVPQNIYLADVSIAGNIALGVPESEINMAAVISAATKAKLDDFISTLPEGYRTITGERGVRLSGGQRQRIGIARALYKEAKILVLDEATSALDTETEVGVMKSIEVLGRELTILVVAHRLSTLATCDKIVELDSGRIISEGAPASILTNGIGTSASTGLRRRGSKVGQKSMAAKRCI